MQKAEAHALRGLELAEKALQKARVARNLAKLKVKADKLYAKAAAKMARAKAYQASIHAWQQRREEIAAAVRNGATGATIAKTYGISRTRAAQLFYRAQRDNRIYTMGQGLQ